MHTKTDPYYSECSTEFKKITAVNVKVQRYKGDSEMVCI